MEIIHEVSGIDICCHNLVCNGYSFLHWHENYELCQVLNQPTAFLVDGQILKAEPGDLICIEESVLHRFLIDRPQTIIRVIQFPTKALLNTSAFVQPLKTHIRHEELHKVPRLEEKLSHIFELMEAEGSNPAYLENPYLQTLAVSLYFLLMRSFAAGEKKNNTQAREKQTFFRILEYINANYTGALTVQSIAEALFLSRNTVARIFTVFSGTTISSYINTLRINKANRLMKQGCNITEAALESGFQSIRTFNFVYKEVMGVTPSEYGRTLPADPAPQEKAITLSSPANP